MVTAYKLRLKDENRKMGVRGGYRFIYLLILGDIKKAIPFHLYSKHAGKKPKSDLTEEEKKNLQNLTSAFNKLCNEGRN
ncbi:hypothetical protein [Faecalicoccus acidiformans]|uniref:hypothetical protein n=1 Tax=Faecalicoccus acidiformans TaxID=915173 RepID=UPI002353DA2A|nr:hypothetical protein [Faecalicoccus acidiformans]